MFKLYLNRLSVPNFGVTSKIRHKCSYENGSGLFPSPTLGLHLKSCFYKAICCKAARRTLRRSPSSDSFTKGLTHKNLLKSAPQAERRKSIKLLLQRRAHRAHPQRSFNTNATIISIVAKHSNYSITHQIILHA